MMFARPNFLTPLLFVAAALPASAAELERVEAVIRKFTAGSPEMRFFRTRTAPMCAATVTIATTASITVATGL